MTILIKQTVRESKWKEVIQNIENSQEDTRRMITRTARFSMNMEAELRKEIKT